MQPLAEPVSLTVESVNLMKRNRKSWKTLTKMALLTIGKSQIDQDLMATGKPVAIFFKKNLENWIFSFIFEP